MKLRDNNIFRFWCYVGIPLIIIILAGMNQSHYYAGLVSKFGIYIILVSSLNLVNGFSGMFSMGHAAFMAIGAYVAAFCTLTSAAKEAALPGLPKWLMHLEIPLAQLHLPMVVGMLMGGLVAMLVALVVGVCVLRMKGHYLSVATLGLIVIVRSVLDNEDEITNGARGISGLRGGYSDTFTIFIVALIVLYILYRTINSGFGRELIAIRDDYTAARSMGVKVTTHRIFAFAMSAFFAGVGGALWGHMQTVISGKFYYYDLSFLIVQISIIGGMYTLSGAVIGSLFMTIVPKILEPLEQGMVIFGTRLPEMYGLSTLILSAFLVVLIIFRRQGIAGYSDNIVKSIFSPGTYKALFDAGQYKEFWQIIISKFKRRKKV